MRDVRGLLKKKEVEYQAKISRIAGFIIQQVIVIGSRLRGLSLTTLGGIFKRP